MRNKSIFFVLKNYRENLPGAEKAQYYISQYFIKHTNWKVIIYCNKIDKTEEKELLKAENVKLIKKNTRFYGLLPLAIYRENPDYFFSWIWKYNLLTALVCKTSRIKNICFNHGFFLKEMNIKRLPPLIFNLQSFFYKFTLNHLVDLIFVPSHELKEDLIRNICPRMSRNIFIQYNGIPIKNKTILKKKINTKDILFTGGFQKHKGIFRLLKIAKSNTSKFFHIYGESETNYKNEVLNIIEREKIQNVLIKGYSNNIIKIYKKFDIFIYPSELDNFPFAILEAMKYGLVIISTDVGELKYILKDGQNSILLKNYGLSYIKDYNLRKISLNAQLEFKKNYTLGVYSSIVRNLNKIYSN